MDLPDRVAVITGGASGIGRATAVALAHQGMHLVLADINDARLEDARQEIGAIGQQVLAVHCDVSLDADVERLAARAAELGPVDLLMNNAGVVLRGALERIEIR